MGFKQYLEHAVWDFLLVALAAVALSYTALNGFYVDPAFQQGPVPALLCALCLLALYAIRSSKRLMLPGGIAYAVVLVVACVVAAAMSSAAVVSDEEGNLLIPLATVFVVATLAFLLSRTKAGCAALLIAGIFTCGWIEFFYQRGELLWALVFLFSSLALIVYKNYQLSASSATSVRTLSFAAGFGLSAGVVAAALAVAALVWFAIIAPLGPGAADIKLITECRALETVTAHGTSSEFLTPNLDTTSDQTNDGVRTTDDLQTTESGGVEMPAKPLESDDSSRQSSGNFLAVSLESIQDAFDFEANPQNIPLAVLAVVLILLLITGYFVGRRVYRTRRLERIRGLEPERQVQQLYLFLLRKLGKLGFKIPAGVTPLEFATSNSSSMERFDTEAGVAFESLSRTYAAVAYGRQPVSQEKADEFAAYYSAFWRAARKQLGDFKYLVKSLTL